MTRTTNSFGALALTILTVFALWTSTLAVPAESPLANKPASEASAA